MKVLLATSEAVPYVKTGGLADVSGTLFSELRGMGMDVRLILPLYRGIKSRFQPENTGISIDIPLGKKVYTARIFIHEKYTLLVECNEFYDRKGVYGTSYGEYEDNADRYIFFSKAVIAVCKSIDFMPDIIHCNDWHTGLVPLYMKSIHSHIFDKTASLFTIHNLEYQGIFPMSVMTLTELDMSLFNPDVIEFYGQVNLMKAGITSANAINTVSVNYSKEILEKDFGGGLEGLLKSRAHDLYGIINGIDYTEWNPSTDKHIKARFDSDDLSGKKKCKSFLAKECLFKNKKAPLLGMVGRISSQKGHELLPDATGRLMDDGINMVVLGSGDAKMQSEINKLAEKYAGNFSFYTGFDNDFAHHIYAGSDMLLMPSRYEPCGLTQMIGMKYGTVPVARATGGLVDTVEDYSPLSRKGTGFLFGDFSASALSECVRRALCSYDDAEKWKKIMLSGMSKDFSWKESAKKYSMLYRDIVKKVRK